MNVKRCLNLPISLSQLIPQLPSLLDRSISTQDSRDGANFNSFLVVIKHHTVLNVFVMSKTYHHSDDEASGDHFLEHDHLYAQDAHTDHLTQLPPEICEKICQLLPSLSLNCLPTISNKLCLTAEKEINIRHRQLKEKVLISQSSTVRPLHNALSKLCPGLILLYSPDTSLPPPHHTHTISLQLLKSLFDSNSPQTCQALSVPHFSATSSLDTTTTSPSCYQLLSLPLCDPTTSVLIFLIPVNHQNIQKVRSLSSWNICLPRNGGLSSLVHPSTYSTLSLPPDHEKAQFILIKEMLGKEPDLNLIRQPLVNLLKMYKDPTSLVVVVTDSHSDLLIQKALRTFFAKIFLPLRVSWVTMI